MLQNAPTGEHSAITLSYQVSLYPLFSLEKKGKLISCQSLGPSSIRPSAVHPCVRLSITFLVLGNISCDLDPRVKGQILYFLVIVSPPKRLDIATSKFVAE